jgi:hypothetical protein
MKNMKYLSVLLSLLLLLGSCCVNKDTCSILTFKKFELINFSSDEATGEIRVLIYKGGSNFTQQKDFINGSGESTSDPNVFVLNTRELDIQDDYIVEIVKTGQKYRVNNFSTEKIACGKCFMRTSNQYGYSLNGYSVNNRAQSYDGKVRIVK